MVVVKSSAPGKLILFGEHASSRGKPAIVFAVNQRLEVKIFPCRKHKILITSENFKVYKEEYPTAKLDVVTNLLSTFFKEYNIAEKPIEIEISSSIKPGFGSSAALIVALFDALFTYFDRRPSKLEFLQICIDFNRYLKGYGSGLDIACALYGGMLKFQQGRKPEPLPFERLNFLVGSTGIKAPSGPIVKAVRAFEAKNPIAIGKIFSRMEELVSLAEDAILEDDQRKLGDLMNENHKLLQELGVSSPILDEMVNAARTAGALGAKLSGAGKGDNMLALVPRERVRDIIQALNATKGAAAPDVAIDPEGLKTEKIDD